MEDDNVGHQLSPTAERILDSIRLGKGKQTRPDNRSPRPSGRSDDGTSRSDGRAAQRPPRAQQERPRGYESDYGDSATVPWNDRRTFGQADGGYSSFGSSEESESERPIGIQDASPQSERQKARMEFWAPNVPKFTLPSTAKLSVTEAKLMRGPLINALGELCDRIDDIMTHTNRNGAQADCWGTISADELAILADVLLAVAQRSGRAAFAVRGIVSAARYLEVGLILGPRFVATVQFYAQNGGIGIPMLMGPLPAHGR